MIDGIYRLYNSRETQPVNLGNPKEFTIQQLADVVIELTGCEAGIERRPLPVDDPRVRQPDISQARELLGWEPTVELRDGLLQTIDYFSSRPDVLADEEEGQG